MIDCEGSTIGKVKDIVINMINYSITSIVVHEGFFKHDTKILMEYLDRFEEGKVFLKISPVTKLIGKKVKDSAGHEIGKIKEVVRIGETNVLDEIIVKMTIILTKDRSGYEHEEPLPGERIPMGEIRTSAESTLMKPSSDVDNAITMSDTETLKEDLGVPSKYIDSIGDCVILNVTKEELIEQIF